MTVGFRNPVLTAVDPVARELAADAAIPQNVLETAASGPRIVVEQIDLPDYVPPPGSPVDVIEATFGRIRFESSEGAAGELSVTSDQLKRRLLLSAGAWDGSGAMPDYPDGFPSPYLALTHSSSEDPPFYARSGTFGNLEVLYLAGADIAGAGVVSADVVSIADAPSAASHAIRRDYVTTRLAGGSASFSFPALSTVYSQTINFPVAMVATPAVVVTAVCNDPQNVALSIGGLSNTGFTLYGRRAANAGTTGVRWVATAF